MVSKKVPIVAIVGRANVGKSSLFNAVLSRREAIVADEPGTTRDSVMAKAAWQDKDFWIIDTAGMKDADDEFEFTIQEQIIQAADSADIIWVVIEAGTVITEEDRRVAKLALKSKKPVVLIVNKRDKAPKTPLDEYRKLGIKDIFPTIATQRGGIAELLDDTVKQLPKASITEASDRLRVAILGRPNVGKSQLFNTLAKKQQAIVADRAGTTRDINHTVIRYEGRELELLDTAGIRRNGKIERGVEHFSVIRSLSAIEQADVVMLLMDANELNVQLDQKLAGLVKEAGKGLILVVSKWDSVEKDGFTRDAMVPQIKHNFAFVPWAPLIFTSAITGQNVAKLFELILDIDKQSKTIIKTPALNRWLQGVVNSHPPAGLKNRSPRLNYIIQEEDNPTNFKVFGSNAKFLHWSYKRYMERSLRENYGFEGVAIKFWFFDKHVTHKHGVKPER
jgi:GTP-binding protein